MRRIKKNKNYHLLLEMTHIDYVSYRKNLAELAEILYKYSRQPRLKNPSIESEALEVIP